MLSVMNRQLSRRLSRLRRLARATSPNGRLVDCPACGSDFVNPVAWEERGETHWWIRLRCGECAFTREVEVPNSEACHFDSDLDRGVAHIAAAVDRLERARMKAAADALIIALERDLITPGDFVRR
jgi:hypothetical protein